MTSNRPLTRITARLLQQHMLWQPARCAYSELRHPNDYHRRRAQISKHRRDTHTAGPVTKAESTSTFAALTKQSFWQCRHTWRRAALNTARCLVGCSSGDLTSMWYLMSYHPDMNMAVSMGISMTSGITASIILETVLLHRGKDRLSWSTALRTALGMSLVSMLAMEATENLVTLAFLTNPMEATLFKFSWVTGLSLLAGFLAPLPYNYVRLKRYGRACH